MKTIISIEGNIGAGKTTLLKELDKHYKDTITIILEPVEEWKRGEENFLELFYNDPHKYAYEFQKVVLLSQIKALKNEIENGKNKIIICDRSFETTIKVFSSLLLENDLLKEEEYAELNNILNSFNILKPSKHIYLRTDPDICLERIKKRNRLEEQNITLDYLFDLDRKHDEMLKNNKHSVLFLNGNYDFLNNETIKQDYFNKILCLV